MKNVNQTVIGILGGMGSYSTLHFFEAIIDAYDVEKEWHRPRIIIDNHCTLPSRTLAILRGERRQELVDGMTESFRGLLRYDPDVTCMPCNTAHCFLPEVRERLGETDPRVLDMIGVVAEGAAGIGADEVFLLATEGTIAAKVYDQYCDEKNVRVRAADDAQQVEIRRYIEQVKQKRGIDAAGFTRFVDSLGDIPVVLGCTELSVIYDGSAETAVLDPVAMMIERIRALG